MCYSVVVALFAADSVFFHTFKPLIKEYELVFEEWVLMTLAYVVQ